MPAAELQPTITRLLARGVADLTVEDPPLEEVMRELFSGDKAAQRRMSAHADALLARLSDAAARRPRRGVAYRAEFLVWMLATTMPLVMLGAHDAVAREAPVGRFDSHELRRLLPRRR